MNDTEIELRAMAHCQEHGFQPVVNVVVLPPHPFGRKLRVVDHVPVAVCRMQRVGGSFLVKSIERGTA